MTLSREQAHVGAGGDRARGARRPRRGAPPATTATCVESRLRRGQLDRADRAHRRAELPGVLRASSRDRLRPQGRLLNHCITRPHNRRQETGAFIDRYVFPDGELTGVGPIITEVQNAGLEVHARGEPPAPLRADAAGWCANLVENWDECVAEVGEGTARVWGLYMAGSRLGFERNEIQLHQVLAVKTDDDGRDGFPLRPDLVTRPRLRLTRPVRLRAGRRIALTR